jgi:acyl-CoA synthetase (AMP-forming)/AMP-acid ligase II
MSIKSPFPDVDIPPVSVFDFLFTSIDDADLERTAFVDGSTGTATDYRSLIAQIDAVAGALAARGVGIGDVVGLLSPNTPAFAVVFHGILRSGAAATTVNALYTAGDIAKQLADSQATMLFTTSVLLTQAKAAAAIVGIVDEKLIVIDGAAGHPSLSELLAQHAAPPDVTFDPATHLAVLPYSSGTTGSPKGVMLSHRNLVANVCQLIPQVGVRADDKLLAVLPFFHAYGLTMLLNVALHQRATLVTMPKFDLHEFLRMVTQYQCTYLFIAPPVAITLAKHPLVDHVDLSSIHTITSGAAPLNHELGLAVARRVGCRVRQGYGMSEMSPVSHIIPLEDGQTRLDSVGPAIPNMECRIVDVATGRDVDYPVAGSPTMSAPGELWCKGPNIMLGYLRNRQATAETLDSDGFLHTGDIATIDGKGNVTIVDRMKELIKYKGYQVPPAELEALLLTHSDIADAAVVGAFDERGEEVPKAFIVTQDGAELNEDGVMAFVAARAAPYKRVRQVEFVDVIPKSPTGKILRRDLRGHVRGQ